MRLIGAHTEGTTHAVDFPSCHWAVSLKDKAAKCEYAGKVFTIEAKEKFLATDQFAVWALNDSSSPFWLDKSLAADMTDQGLDVDVEMAKREIQKKATIEAAKLPAGYPDANWRPTQLVELYGKLNPDNIDYKAWILWEPKRKAKALADYMVRKGLKPEAYA
jgi:hypothetical protein